MGGAGREVWEGGGVQGWREVGYKWTDGRTEMKERWWRLKTWWCDSVIKKVSAVYWTGQLPVKKRERVGRTGRGSDAVARSQSCPYEVSWFRRKQQ